MMPTKPRIERGEGQLSLPLQAIRRVNQILGLGKIQLMELFIERQQRQ